MIQLIQLRRPALGAGCGFPGGQVATSAAGSTIGGQGVCVPVHLGLSWEIYAVYMYIYNYIIFTDRNHIYICMYVYVYIYTCFCIVFAIKFVHQNHGFPQKPVLKQILRERWLRMALLMAVI